MRTAPFARRNGQGLEGMFKQDVEAVLSELLGQYALGVRRSFTGSSKSTGSAIIESAPTHQNVCKHTTLTRISMRTELWLARALGFHQLWLLATMRTPRHNGKTCEYNTKSSETFLRWME